MTTSTIRYEDLPFWMRRAMRRTDWGVLLILGFCLISSLPFVLSTSIPVGTAHERYAFRAAEIAESIGEGRWYPRWTDEAVGGYGAPIPQFTPPLAGFLPALLDITLINDPGAAISATFVFATCLAGTALYAFVARRAGSIIGVTAALLYVFNPMIGVVMPRQLGDLSLILGGALLPALLWAVDGLMQRRAAADLAAAVLLSAGLLLLDTRFAAAGLGAALLLILVNRSHGRRVPWVRLLIAGLLGIAIASFHWLPAALEAYAVRWYPAEIAPSNRIDLLSLFAPVVATDPAALLDPPAFSLGAFPLVAVPGALLTLLRRNTQRPLYAAFLAAAVGLIVAAVVRDNQVWMLVPAALCISIAGASLINLREWLPLPLRRVFPVAVCAVAIGTVLQPWIAATAGLNTAATPRDFSSDAAASFEQRGVRCGDTTTWGQRACDHPPGLRLQR
ncbi:MAG: hypothetical protein IPK19_30585 [Chloroflexi bacterium]|nr:hypothetical protein [Chloroflexota bacterium]